MRKPIKKAWPVWGGVVATVVLIASLLGGLPAAADENSTTSLAITQVSPDTQESGSGFLYRLAYSCSNLNNVVCGEDPVITIPLGDADGMTVNVAGSAAIASWEVVGGELLIHLNDLPEGSAGPIDFTVTPPNRTTPNGTTWTLGAAMTFGDGTTPGATAPSTVTSTATAAPSLRVTKNAPQEFYLPGDQVTYQILWGCPDSGAAGGVENLTGLTLVDTLPAGLTFVSSTPVATIVAGQVVTIDIDEANLGSSCSSAAGSSQVTIVATVDDDVADGTVLTNVVTGTGTPLSGSPSVESTDSDGITVIDTFGAGTASKTGYGPVTNTVGDSASWYPGRGGYLSGTYPGAWLDTGIAADRDGRALAANGDQVYGRTEALYELSVRMPVAGLEHAVVDPIPCRDNAAGPIFSSKAPGDLCQDPAFNPTMVTVRVFGGGGNNGIESDYIPQARLTDGSVVDLEPGPIVSSEVSPGLLYYRSYYVPASHVENVAELIFPRSSTSNLNTYYYVGGYADDQQVGGDVLRNNFQLESFAPGADEPYATGLSRYGSVYVLSGPQLGMLKFVTGSGAGRTFTLEASFVAPDMSQVTGPLTIVDRIPAGLEVAGPVTFEQAYEWTTSTFHSIDWDYTQAIDPETGDTVITIEFPLEQFAAVRTGGNWNVDFDVPVTWEFPGEYVNTAQATLNDGNVNDTFCRRGTPVDGTSGTSGPRPRLIYVPVW